MRTTETMLNQAVLRHSPTDFVIYYYFAAPRDCEGEERRTNRCWNSLFFLLLFQLRNIFSFFSFFSFRLTQLDEKLTFHPLNNYKKK